MNLVGDPEGLDELKKMREERKHFLKFLITEAKTSLKRVAVFKGSNGKYWALRFEEIRNELDVQTATQTDLENR